MYKFVSILLKFDLWLRSLLFHLGAVSPLLLTLFCYCWSLTGKIIVLECFFLGMLYLRNGFLLLSAFRVILIFALMCDMNTDSNAQTEFNYFTAKKYVKNSKSYNISYYAQYKSNFPSTKHWLLPFATL